MDIRDIYDLNDLYEEYMAVKPTAKEAEFIFVDWMYIRKSKEDNSHDVNNG